MAYFKSNERNPDPAESFTDMDEDYDDGFDDLQDEDTEPYDEEERTAQRRNRVRFAEGAGNMIALIGGTLLILLLVLLIISMIYFVMNDMGRSFSLFQTNF